jgi:tRNA(adenine34) deaminase
MWDTLTRPWQVCLEEAWNAYCAGSVPIGAAITDNAGEVLARGRNRIHESRGAGIVLYGHALAHAEINALISLDHCHTDYHACILYTTTEPCPLCLGAFYMSGVREVRYASRDPYAGSVNLLGKTPYLSCKPIKAIGPQRNDLERSIMALYVEYALRYGGERYQVVFDEWERAVPQSICFGRQLYQSGLVAWMREGGTPAAQVFERLASLVKAEE